VTQPDPDIAELARVAALCADAAREPALRWFRQPTLAADDKAGGAGRFDPVTAADRAVEAAIRATLATHRPDDAIRGEEEAPTAGRSGIRWTVDPIDGTRGFMAGTPTWGVLIAADAGGAPLVGIIDQPFTGERFTGLTADPGRGCTWARGTERRPLACRPCATLAEATLFTTFPEIGTAAERAAFARVAGAVRLTRYGLDCYAYALVAAGCVDLVIEAGLHPYDVAAPIAVIEAAGGIVTDWQGGPAHEGGRIVAAGDARVHAAALALLGGG
jgi:histidinol phosphatase-like enzyme (inositol monophosphatase family)